MGEALSESLASHERHQQQNAVALESFKILVNKKAWNIRGSTPDDGNCCFWALSDQLDRVGSEISTHTELRQKVVRFLREMSEVLTLPFHQFRYKYSKHNTKQNICFLLKVLK